MPWTHFRPTPEQIQEKCREIRAGWDEATHRKRWVRPIHDFWSPPVVTLALLFREDNAHSVCSSHSSES